MRFAKYVRSGQIGTTLALTLPLMLAGCVTLPTTDSLTSLTHEAPCQIVTTWQPDVIQTQDSVNQGRPLLGLGGRLYIFGKEIGKPLKTKGTVVVDLYDLSKTRSDEPVHLEQWTMDAKVLTQLGRNDPLGFGYTMFLPWSTCRPEVNQILLKIKFQPKHGYPLYTECGPMTINHPGSILNDPEFQTKVTKKVYSGEEYQALQNQNKPAQTLSNPTQPGGNPNRFVPGEYAPGNRLSPPNQGPPAPNTQFNPVDRPASNLNFQQGQSQSQDNRMVPNGRADYGRQGYASQDNVRDNGANMNSTPNRAPIGIPVGSAPARLGFVPSQNPSEGSLPIISMLQANQANQANQGGPSLSNPSNGSTSNPQVVPRFAIVPSGNGR